MFFHAGIEKLVEKLNLTKLFSIYRIISRTTEPILGLFVPFNCFCFHAESEYG